MDPHRTLRMRPETTRAERRKAAQRRRFVQHLLASFILAGTALALVLLFGQSSEPPVVEATLPDKPEPTEPVQGFELDREAVLAPVAAGSVSRGAQKPVDGRSRTGEGDGTGQPPPAIPVIPDPPVPAAAGPAEGPIGPKPTTDDVDDEPPPPPVTTAPPVAVDEEKLTRPPIDLPVDPVDESEEQVVEEQPEETGATPERDLAEEEQQEETVNDPAGGGVVKGPGSILEKGSK